MSNIMLKMAEKLSISVIAVKNRYINQSCIKCGKNDTNNYNNPSLLKSYTPFNLNGHIFYVCSSCLNKSKLI